MFKFTEKKSIPTRSYYYLGEICVVIHEIEWGEGKIRAKDGTIWAVTGEDCDINTHVEVVEIIEAMLFRVRVIY